MHPRVHFTLSITISIALHALVIAALFLIKPAHTEMPLITPVEIVNLPQQAIQQLPPLNRPQPVTPPPPVPERFLPEKPLAPSAVPLPEKFGASEELKLPKTVPRSGVPEGAERGKETGKPGAEKNTGTGPLPFLTQNDIDELARKGMPQKRPGENSVTLDTDEFKFMSYNCTSCSIL
jgi:hypothetical protein